MNKNEVFNYLKHQLLDVLFEMKNEFDKENISFLRLDKIIHQLQNNIINHFEAFRKIKVLLKKKYEYTFLNLLKLSQLTPLSEKNNEKYELIENENSLIISAKNKLEKKYCFLFLDDVRHPNEVLNYDTENSGIYTKYKWDVVRHFDEFKEHILSLEEMPVLISFDHDLHDEHYTPEEYWHDYELSKEYQIKRYFQYLKPTGLDCLRWLLSYCKENKIKTPEIICHSQNPVGKDFIYELHKLHKTKIHSKILCFKEQRIKYVYS